MNCKCDARGVTIQRGIAIMVGGLMSQKEGNLTRVVQEIGVTLCTSHMDGNGIRVYYEGRRKVESAEDNRTNHSRRGAD